MTERRRLAIHFTDGSELLITRVGNGFAANIIAEHAASAARYSMFRPTVRQLEYLEFIKKYIGRFGYSPAESDIQRAFLVSAPSVHQMVVTLERRGFITREPGVPRSIRVVD
jgi:repressor LexA